MKNMKTREREQDYKTTSAWESSTCTPLRGAKATTIRRKDIPKADHVKILQNLPNDISALALNVLYSILTQF